jgi:POT family proton-dependent oligopeptide transporter
MPTRAGQDAIGSGPLRGHPRALPFILICQAGFAFSITGMLSIGVLYMSTYLFQPGHIERIIGFGPVRAMLGHIGGSDQPAALASVTFGLTGACAYLTPLIGGFISDRTMTRGNAVMLGAACCAAGQLLIALEATFLAGIGLVLVGSGLVGVNIATQLGDLYAQVRADLADAFQAIHICVNLAGIAGVLVCGGLGQGIAWRWGYVAAACGMVLGLLGYAAGRHRLPAEPLRPGGTRPLGKRPLGERTWTARVAGRGWAAGDGKTVAALLALLPGLLLAGLANGQVPNAYLIWGGATFRLQVFGRAIPASWLVAGDAAFAVAASLVVLAFWRRWARRRKLPNDLTRIAIGAFIAAFAPLILALASEAAVGGHRVSLAWAVAYHTIDNLGMVAIGPVAVSVFARMGPRAVAALMMGVLNANAFGSALAVGFLGTMLPRLGGTRFWLLHAGLVAFGAVVVVLLRVSAGARFEIAGAAAKELELAKAGGDEPSRDVRSTLSA